MIGRGPLAGPVVAAACIITDNIRIDGIMDSKLTKEADREILYDILTNHPNVHCEVCIISNEEIDEINILEASLKAMRTATSKLLKKISHIIIDKTKCLALIDGNKIPKSMEIDSHYVIKGDSIMFSIAAASIIAKVTRDRIMIDLDKQYPLYNLAQHKGYPTFEHRSLLLKHGPCPIHRVSYAPVKLAIAQMAAIKSKKGRRTSTTTVMKSTRRTPAKVAAIPKKSSQLVTANGKKSSIAMVNETFRRSSRLQQQRNDIAIKERK